VTSDPTSSERRRGGCCADRSKPWATRTAATAGAYITTAAILAAWAPAVVAGLAALVVLAGLSAHAGAMSVPAPSQRRLGVVRAAATCPARGRRLRGRGLRAR